MVKELKSLLFTRLTLRSIIEVLPKMIIFKNRSRVRHSKTCEVENVLCIIIIFHNS